MFLYKPKNRGSALLSALFIMTLVAIACTAISLQLSRTIYRTQLVVTADELNLASQYVYFWAISKLKSSIPLPFKPGQGLLTKFPIALRNSYPGLTIEGELYDLQSCFNLNNLAEKQFISSFATLANQTTGLPKNNARALALAIQQWISPSDLNQGQNSLAALYQKKNPPYFPAHQLMKNSNESKLINGMNPSLFQKLVPFITALPEVTAININTASKAVLSTLKNGSLSEDEIKRIIDKRGKSGFKNDKQLTELLNELNLDRQSITLNTQYFLAIAHVSGQNLSLTVSVVLQRLEKPQQETKISLLDIAFNTI